MTETIAGESTDAVNGKKDMSKKEKPSMRRVSWEFMEESGILWYINTMIAVYGVYIAIKRDKNGKRPIAIPCRTSFRGFEDRINDEQIVKLSRYLATCASELLEEAEE
jgi:hypothetical protein